MTNRMFKIWLAVTLLLIPVACVIQASVWKECRTEHSFFYCTNLLSGK